MEKQVSEQEKLPWKSHAAIRPGRGSYIDINEGRFYNCKRY